ncbi:MAG: glycosyltransferase family 1 protein [Patescibacteria group bacterium]|jgi:glycosyltransferase involved in cell wall biosynthesis|nr:glycosyltransferase family 1 protein [Patescibacteria group bacterium]MDD3778151.1 glycosyltransferase family 1 protein [Patescibacteria group bacterium]MDD4443621.1 glycosyltransferase family 1 protein [Patescibacteria group bacterium]
MRIGIDARFYGPIGKGLGRYTQEVIDNMIKINEAQAETACDFVIFLSPHNYDEFTPKSWYVKKIKINIPWYSWQEQIFFPFYIFKEKLDLMHFPHFNIPVLTPVKFVMTLHDLILTHFPTVRATTKSAFVYKFKNFAYRFVLRTAVSRARKIIAVSEFTKKDILNKLSVPAEKVVVTYEGVSNLARGRDSLFVSKIDPLETKIQYHLGDNFLLYVGNAYPHKNLEKLLDAFILLKEKRPDYKLVLVGKADYFYNRLRDYAKSLNLWQKENLNSPVVFPGYVPDAQLEVLYKEARAYVFPSLYEGFGLPPLEAMAKGCPVISSDRASLPEVLGSAALYFNPEDTQDFLAKINLVLDDAKLRNEMIDKGLKQVKMYNWWECANNTYKVYKDILFSK